LFYKSVTATKVLYFSKICCHFKFQGPTLNSTSVAPALDVCTASMLVLLTVGN